MAVAAFLIGLMHPAYEYTREEWVITTPALNIPNSFRVASIGFGLAAMLVVVLAYAWKTVKPRNLVAAAAIVAGLGALCCWQMPALANLGNINIAIFLVGLVGVCLAAGVPIAFCFGLGALSFLTFTTQMPLLVVIGRMDEGMSSIILVSVPIFVLLGCVLDATGMGKAIVDFLASLLGHVKAGMSYVLLGSLFIVSGISGSKVSDMATVAPALFPEMERRGNKRKEMVALLATGAAMADTVPPSIVLIVLGSVAGRVDCGSVPGGFVVAMVLLLALLVLARWKARHEVTAGLRRAPWKMIGRVALIAAPALILPFLIRSIVGGGVATATEVSTIAVLYAMIIGQLLYGGITRRRLYAMLVETAALSGAILLILGAASAMAWTITQSGVVQQLSQVLTSLPGGWMTFMAVTVVVFLVLGCLLEGLPAVLLLAPIMYPDRQEARHQRRALLDGHRVCDERRFDDAADRRGLLCRLPHRRGQARRGDDGDLAIPAGAAGRRRRDRGRAHHLDDCALRHAPGCRCDRTRPCRCPTPFSDSKNRQLRQHDDHLQLAPLRNADRRQRLGRARRRSHRLRDAWPPIERVVQRRNPWGQRAH